MFSLYSRYFITYFGLIYKKIKRISIIVLTILTIFLLFFSLAFNKKSAQKNYISMRDLEKPIYEFIDNPTLNKTPEGKLVVLSYKTFTCFLVGIGCTQDREKTLIYFDNSFFGLFAKGILLPYQHPPASGIQSTLNAFSNAGLVPKTYAATGIGFGTLSPLMGLWSVSRNVSYLLLVLVIVLVGFMIIFRMKINPQTVVMLENALPNIVLSLIYITFSFAIVGFLIDLMYVSIAFIIAILATADPVQFTPQEILKQQVYYLDSGLGQVFSNMTNRSFLGFDILWHLPHAIISVVPLINFLFTILGVFIALIISAKLANFLAPEVTFHALVVALGELFKKYIALPAIFIILIPILITIVVTTLVPLVFGIIILFTVIMIFFRIFFLLVGAYAKIILLTIFAPFYLLFEAVPGQKAFVQWLKYLIVELIPFPTIIGIFMLVKILSSSVFSSSSANIANQINFPLLTGMRMDMLSLIVIFWMLFMIPDFITIIKQRILPKPAIPEAGLGVFFGGASTVIGQGTQTLSHWGLMASHFGFEKPFQKALGFVKGITGKK